MNQITCPKCNGTLVQVVHKEIEVDRCSHCGGIWFDDLELDQLKTIEGSEILDTGNPEIGCQFDRIEKDIDCPRCKIKMMRMLDIDEYSIWYEKCPECHGIWLDAGEFKKFKHNFQPSLLERAKRFWHRSTK